MYGGPLVTIEQARSQPDSIVTVDGVVTVGWGQISTSSIYVQDRTGGIEVSAFGPAQHFPGDSVRVTGRMMRTGTNLWIGSPGTAPGESFGFTEIVPLGRGTLPRPRRVTGAEIRNLVYPGQLVCIEDAEVVAVHTPPHPPWTWTSFSVTLRDVDGEEFGVGVFSLRQGLWSDQFVVGQRYTIVGVLESHSGTQLQPTAPLQTGTCDGG
jgi:hypothetical protein